MNLEGLRLVWQIRSMVASHRSGSDAEKIARNAISEHGSYRGHFEHVCNQVSEELELIEQVLGSAHGDC